MAVGWGAGPGRGGAAVRIAGLEQTYGGGQPTQVLRRVDLAIEPGESVAVMGRSGSGKSTLLHLIAGLDRATGGQILVDDVPVHAMRPARSARWRGRTVGIVFQFFQLLPGLTLRENVLLPMELAGYGTRRGRAERAAGLLGAVGLERELDRLPTQVSGGQQQRAALARALANDPPLLLADEPTGNLDDDAARQVEALLAGIVRAGRTLVLVTHDAALAQRVGRCVTLRDGRLR